MKKISEIFLVAIMIISFAGCGVANAPPPEPLETSKSIPAEIVSSEASRSEAPTDTTPAGKVMCYTSMYQDIIDMMDEALAAKFPESNIEFFYAGTGDIQTKIAAEMESGNLGCDFLLLADPAYSLELKERGYLHAYKSPNAASLRFPYDEEGCWYPVRVCNMVLAYNPEIEKAEELPQSFRDFAEDENVKDAISMGNPLTSGTTMAAVSALTGKYGYEWFEALGKQGVAVESASSAIAKLEPGTCKEAMILEESILKVREEGSKLEVIYPTDGNILIPSTIMTIAEEKSLNKNILLCEAVTDWLLSPEGQQFVVKGWMHSVLKGYPEKPFDSVNTDSLIKTDMGVDWVRCYTMREEIRTKFSELVRG